MDVVFEEGIGLSVEVVKENSGISWREGVGTEKVGMKDVDCMVRVDECK